VFTPDGIGERKREREGEGKSISYTIRKGRESEKKARCCRARRGWRYKHGGAGETIEREGSGMLERKGERGGWSDTRPGHPAPK